MNVAERTSVVQALAEQLIDAIDNAPSEVAFDKNGNGPLPAIIDGANGASRRPIRSTAKALRQALLDLDAAQRIESLR
jgi:hypothetical protein